MTTAVLVAAGGAVGAALRYLVGRRFAMSGFPWGTLLVNGAGCLLLGLVARADSSWVRALLGTGLAGALTTYSSFALESVLLERNGHRRRAVVNVAATFALGGLAFTAGWLLG